MKVVQFEDQDYYPRKNKRKKYVKKNSELVSWVMNKGWIKNENIISLIFILISFLFIFISIVFFSGGQAFGFSNKFDSRVNNSYYINIPGVEESVLIRPGENLNEVVEQYAK